MNDRDQESRIDDLPSGLAAPARRALAAAGCHRLDQVAALSEEEIRQLHGIGPRALDQLHRALAGNGLSFRKGDAA